MRRCFSQIKAEWGFSEMSTLAHPTHMHDKNILMRLYSFQEDSAMRMLLNWILSALAVWIVAQVVPGVHVNGAVAALIAALAIGFINATLGLLLKIITFPLTLLTLGIFWFVINALMLELASAVVPGFQVRSFVAAFIGAIVLSLVNLLLKGLLMPSKDNR
jgi:putative membrane protein